MSKAQSAARAYSAHSVQTKSLRDQEYEVILEVTRQMKRLHSQKTPQFEEVIVALNKNERLWNTIGAQVADDANELPQALRAGLLYMSRFVAVQTGKVLREKSDFASLVEMNIAVLRGLKGAT